MLKPVGGVSFRDPLITETVFTLGYPRVPLSRTPHLVMQRGEVTAEDVVLFSEHHVFLYSAVARPGNSGGPILAETGHVVGIVIEELMQDSDKLITFFMRAFLPRICSVHFLQI